MSFQEQIGLVTQSYNKRIAEHEKAEKEIWKGFDDETKQLEDFVHDEFKNHLIELGPISSSSVHSDSTAEILEYTVKYNPQFKWFTIQITKINADGRIINKGAYDGCTCSYMDTLQNKSKEFEEQYNICTIESINDCTHK